MLKKLIGMKGGDIFHQLLIHNGVEHIFGYPGGAVLTLLDVIYGSDKLQFILTRHEQGAGHMTDGYAQATGRTGVVLVTSGPGTSNLATAMLNALLDGNPIVVICGQVATDALGTNAFQEIDVPALAKPCTKWVTVVQKIEDLPFVVRDGFRAAHGRVAWTGTIERVAKLINTAERPVIIAGHGVLNVPRAPSRISELSELAQIPAEALHMVGTHGAVYANYAVQNADLILALGARLDERVVSDLESFAPKAMEAEQNSRGGIIQFDIEPDNVNKVVQVTEAVLGDLNDTLPLGSIPRPPNLTAHILPSHVPIEVNRQTNLSSVPTIVTTGVGQHQMWATRCYRWRSPRTLITSGDLGTMGFGVPAAIGAKIGCTDSKVINIDGDGSFSMTMQELLTASQHNVKIKVIIFNNEEQKMMTHLKNPDFVTLAQSFGCEARRCHLVEELESSIHWLLEVECPATLDVNLESEPPMLPIVRVGVSLDTFIMEQDFEYTII
ncbi:thiamine diphosphate-binding protein [Aspergillus caelatus]|uniref:Thiamine diphosphate-binding protein n=1 Tax=Aspergillus caelatus TaxID=61420 RepID=A0A5N6ZND6_9EURO|nr:thiamine diphosphate-binding protein [Aspergillus caelatus]KAE8359134.1 thiamine diphosphate-binding protein [Aspergillus caelatus]